MTITGPTEARPANGLVVDFVVESDRAQLSEIVQRVRDGRLRTNIGNVSTLDDAVAAFNRTERRKGKTIIRVRQPREITGRGKIVYTSVGKEPVQVRTNRRWSCSGPC